MNISNSFSEQALFYPYYLKQLYSLEYQEQVVDNPSSSVMETIQNLDFPVQEKVNVNQKALSKKIMCYTYPIFVGLLIAPSGVIFHGVLSMKNLINHFIFNLENAKDLENHWDSFITDLKVCKAAILSILGSLFIIGAPISILSVLRDFPKHGKGVEIIFLLFSMVLLVGSAVLLSGLLFNDNFSCVMDPLEFIKAFSNKKQMVGKAISFQLWKEFGLIASDGRLLPSNAEDSIQVIKKESFVYGSPFNFSDHGRDRPLKKYTFTFVNVDNDAPSKTLISFNKLIFKSEIDFIPLVCEFNLLASKRGLEKIEFHHPIGADTVIKKIKEIFQKILTSRKERNLILRMERLRDREIKLRNILRETVQLAVDHPGFIYSMPSSSFSQLSGKTLFDATSCQLAEKNAVIIKKMECFNSLNHVEAIDPDLVKLPPEASLSERCKYQVGVARFQLSLGMEISLKDVFCLDEITEPNIEKRFRGLSRCLHPDKTPDLALREIFSLLNNLRDMTIEEFKSCSY